MTFKDKKTELPCCVAIYVGKFIKKRFETFFYEKGFLTNKYTISLSHKTQKSQKHLEVFLLYFLKFYFLKIQP